LNFALADANGFLDAIEPVAGRLFLTVNVTTLFDAQLTRESLIKALADIQARAKPDDVFVFFYAGHGIAMPEGKQTDFYFVLPAVTGMSAPEKVKAGGLSSAELRDFAAQIPAMKQMLLVDACNAGAFAEGFALRGAAEELALAQLARSSGAVVITATTDQQSASEIAALRHGVFTYAIIEGLGGKAAKPDGSITANSLRLWVDDAVPELSKEYNGSEQFPTTFMFGQDFPLGLWGSN
ncbi:MAG: caspase family protein, partial [Spirochaetia bacterium]